MSVPVMTRDQAAAAVQAAVSERDASQAHLLERDSSVGQQRQILRAALGWAGESGRPPARTSGDGLILGCEPNERSLRFGLERGYRALARLTSDRSRRIELVDMANAVRPKTWSGRVRAAGGR